MIVRRAISAAVAAMLLWVCQSVLAEPAALVAYRGATLINGTGNAAIEHATILVQGRKSSMLTPR